MKKIEELEALAQDESLPPKRRQKARASLAFLRKQLLTRVGPHTF